ncbi:MAG: hypothetical protein LBT05_15185 [Planctomycetaceae bacterium]|jgi:hypothetical protein|nr:hypothetical protein [Planctomycetaceae bacterium]
MKYSMSRAAAIIAVVGMQVALISTVEAQNFGRLRSVVQRPVAGRIIGTGAPVLGRDYGTSASPAVAPVPRPLSTSQLHFIAPEELTVNWDVVLPGAFDSDAKIIPFRQNFPQGAIYRVKLSNVPARPDKVYYPTIEVAATMARSQAFLAHNSIPIEFTDNDFDQVDSGNFVTKVVYLPDPEFQGLAMAGVGTLVNTQLEPGSDPITEADRRGSILAIIRLGNKDLETSAIK